MSSREVAALKARHTDVHIRMSALNAAHPGGELGDDAAEWDRLDGEARSLEAAVLRQDRLEELQRASAATAPGSTRPTGRIVRVGGTDIAQPEAFDGQVMETQDGRRVPLLQARHRLADFMTPEQRDEEPIGFGRLVRAMVMGPRDDAEKRALAESSIGSGGATVPTPLSAQIIDLARAKNTAIQAGVVTAPMESQTLKYARMLGDASGGWRTESSAITESAQTFDNVTLTAQSWALLTRISRELLADGENIDAALMNSFAAGAALGIDAAILYGTGTAPMPRGITNTSGIQSVSMGTNGGQLLTTAGWSKMLDAVAALEGANLGTVSAMIMAPRTARQIYGFVDTTGQPLTVPPRLAGIPILTTTAASVTETQGTSGAVASSILLGDFSQVILGLRNSLQISVLNERYADTGQIGFVSWIRADVLVARPAALARIIGILP